MRKLNGILVSEKTFAFIRRRYIQFHENHVQCSDACPMFRKDSDEFYGEEKIEPRLRYLTKQLDVIDRYSFFCICQLFQCFMNKKNHIGPDKHQGCPCRIFGEEAFKKLDRLVRRLKNNPDIYKVNEK